MIDPLTSLGLASNIMQLVSFGIQVIDKAKELAVTGSTAEQEHLRAIAGDTSRICRELHDQIGLPAVTHQHNKHGQCLQEAPEPQSWTSHRGVTELGPNKAMGELACRTRATADELQDLL